MVSAAADLIITGARIYTVDAARTWAEAIAIRGGRIVGIGLARDVEPLAGAGTKRWHLPGRMVMPSFQDAHVHPSMAGLDLTRCTLNELSSSEAYLDYIKEYADAHPELPWILGSGWYMDMFPRGVPHKKLLDRIVPDRPVFLVNRDGHGAWVNSKALEMAGITAATADPADGRIERDEDGEPWGTLHEGSQELVTRIIPPTTTEELERGILEGQRYLLELGVTAWQDAWVTPEILRGYRNVAERGALKARVRANHWWERGQGGEQIDDIIARREWGAVGRLNTSTVKIMQDGVAENYTAAMLEPYLDADGKPTDNAGISFVDPVALKEHVSRLDAEGFQVHVHGLGDRAAREALDAFETAIERNGRTDNRHHIAHLQVVHPDDYPRFRRLNVTANAQPFWACNDGQMVNLTVPFLGPRRAAWQYPWASLRKAGARLVFGSDWFVSTPNPFLEMEVAITRRPTDDRGKEVFLPDERIDLTTAVDAFTINCAYVNHLDRDTGSLEAGKLADLVVVDQDIFEMGEKPLGEARVLATMIEGEVVYRAPGFDS